MGCINWAWKIQGLKSNEKVLLLAIADRADKESGLCISPITRLSRDAGGWTRQTTNKVLKRLEAHGLVRVTLRYPGTEDFSRMYSCNITIDAETWRPAKHEGRRPSAIMSTFEKFRSSFQTALLNGFREELGPAKGYGIYETWLSALQPIDIRAKRLLCRIPGEDFSHAIWPHKDLILKIAATLEPSIKILRFVWHTPRKNK